MTELQIDKINDLLMLHHNIFISDMITRAVQDESLPREDFIRGYREIMQAKQVDNDEFVPGGWEKVGLYDGATARIEWHTTADMPETGKRCLMEYEADGEIRYRVDWRSEYEWVETCHYDRVLRWTYIKDILGNEKDNV